MEGLRRLPGQAAGYTVEVWRSLGENGAGSKTRRVPWRYTCVGCWRGHKHGEIGKGVGVREGFIGLFENEGKG